MNAPSVAMSSDDTSQTRADHGRAENLVQETITRFDIWTPRWQLASPRRALLFTGFAWLSIAVIALRSTRAPVTTDVLAFLAAAVATAEESLGLLSRLAATLLDVTRLQAGARSVFPRPADLEEIITCSLAGLGPSGRTVRVDLPPGLPKVVADPPVMERVIANLTANALRYSPAGVPPLVTARARSGRIELRVIDCGPGVPQADGDRMFAPFQRLGNTDSTTGVGLGLAVSRGLTEAMRGTLQPAQTPGGGLTMTMSLPAAPRPTRAHLRGCRPQGTGS
jgi:two-component system, OmpR family, sensor histidine kinase KdpD